MEGEMGEAKYRKQNDPNYGKPSKIRGLVLSYPMEVNSSENTLRLIQDRLDDQDLRSALMYWDRLSLPKSNVMNFPTDPNIEYLTSSGILTQPIIKFIGEADFAEAVVSIQGTALRHYEEQAPGVWSLGQGVNSLRQKDVDHEPGALIQLLNAVPVPGPDVPFAEILEFKAKRRDELLQFRDHFESLIARIAEHENSEEELIQVIQEVDQACSNLIKTTKEWQYPVKLTNVKSSINFNIAKAIEAAGNAYEGLLKTPLALSSTSTAVAIGGAAVLSQIKFEAGVSFRGIKRPKSPYSYAYLVQRDLQ